MRLLLVEDEEDLALGLHRGLTRAGYAVDVAGSVAAATDRLAVHPYDVLLLDLSLPDGDGLTLCAGLLDGTVGVARDVPRVLMLTARGSLSDRVRGLDDGADDYVVKPVALPELLARVRALLRRGTADGRPILTVGSLRLDPATFEASRDGERLPLSPKEFGLLEYLMRHPGAVIGTEELLDHVWDENADPFTSTVRVTLGTLRRKLGDGGTALIETVVGRGYRLVVP